MTRVQVDPDSGVAPWRQVRDQLVHLIRVGELPVGAPLPPIRQLARDLGLSVGTVARVYRELEAAGVLGTARRRGTVVVAVPRGDAGVATALAEAAAEYVASAKALGVDPHDAVQAVLHAYRDEQPGGPASARGAVDRVGHLPVQALGVVAEQRLGAEQHRPRAAR